MATALAGRSPESLTGCDTLVFAPGAVSSEGIPLPGSASGSVEHLGSTRDARAHALYAAQHHVFWGRPDNWTELANQAHWWKPAADLFAVTFTSAHLIIERPTVATTQSNARTRQVDASPEEVAWLSEPVGQHRIKKVFVTKPTGLMWDRSDIHVVANNDGEDLAITVVGLETLAARRLAGRFAAAAAQRRLQEREFIEEHDAEWLEGVAFTSGAALELDWAWLYELPAHH